MIAAIIWLGVCLTPHFRVRRGIQFCDKSSVILGENSSDNYQSLWRKQLIAQLKDIVYDHYIDFNYYHKYIQIYASVMSVLRGRPVPLYLGGTSKYLNRYVQSAKR